MYQADALLRTQDSGRVSLSSVPWTIIPFFCSVNNCPSCLFQGRNTPSLLLHGRVSLSTVHWTSVPPSYSLDECPSLFYYLDECPSSYCSLDECPSLYCSLDECPSLYCSLDECPSHLFTGRVSLVPPPVLWISVPPSY